MKKVVASILALSILMGMTACSKTKNNDNSSVGTSSSENNKFKYYEYQSEHSFLYLHPLAAYLSPMSIYMDKEENITDDIYNGIYKNTKDIMSSEQLNVMSTAFVFSIFSNLFGNAETTEVNDMGHTMSVNRYVFEDVYENIFNQKPKWENFLIENGDRLEVPSDYYEHFFEEAYKWPIMTDCFTLSKKENYKEKVGDKTILRAFYSKDDKIVKVIDFTIELAYYDKNDLYYFKLISSKEASNDNTKFITPKSNPA